MNRSDTRLIGRIAPVTDEQAAGLASAGTLASLAAQIMATPADPADPARENQNRNANAPRRRTRKRVLVALPAAAAAAAAGIVAGLLAASPAPLPAAAYKALSFTVQHGYINVIVKNPYADPSWYNADFQAHHLDITLEMRPVSPSMVGTVIYAGSSPSAVGSEVTMIYAPCAASPSGDHKCAIGIRVALDFHGQYDVEFGRTARPGEQYASVNSAFAPGEALHGMKYIIGQPVSTVLKEIGKRHLSAILNDHHTFGPVSKFPGTWYVNDALPYAPGQVMLFVSRSRSPQP